MRIVIRGIRNLENEEYDEIVDVDFDVSFADILQISFGVKSYSKTRASIESLKLQAKFLHFLSMIIFIFLISENHFQFF